jgi:hypothetical protein
MRSHRHPLHSAPIFIARRRRHNRIAQWVGLLALAGLLAIATLPSHDAPQVHADEIGAAPLEMGHLENGSASWHG